MKSHMPQSLLTSLGLWFQDLMILLDTVMLEKKMDLPEQEPRLKTWKRVLQICCNLVTRHRKHVDKYDAVQLLTCVVNLLQHLRPHQESLLSARTEYMREVISSGIYFQWELQLWQSSGGAQLLRYPNSSTSCNCSCIISISMFMSLR